MPADVALRASQQDRISAARPHLPVRPKDLHQSIVRKLVDASDDERLATPLQHLSKTVKLMEAKGGSAVILGGTKSWECAPENAVFRRVDDAWFTFRVEVVPGHDGRLWLETYAFHLCFPAGCAPAYVRFELDGPNSPHVAEGLRCHVTPGAPDLRLPSPVLSPVELLDILLYGTPVPDLRSPAI